MSKTLWSKKIRYIEGLKDKDLIKFECFSVVTTYMLSKEEFKHNVDLIIFMEALGLKCKPYLYKSRTAMLTRTIRYLDKSEVNEILQVLSIIKKRITEEKCMYFHRFRDGINKILIYLPLNDGIGIYACMRYSIEQFIKFICSIYFEKEIEPVIVL